MKRAHFMHGVGIAFVFAFCGALAFYGLAFFLGYIVLLKLLIAVTAGAYIIALMVISQEKIGRLAVAILWLVSALGIWVVVPDMTMYFIAHLLMIWLIRSLYFYTSVLPAIFDFGLCTLSGLAVAATIHQSHSIFLAIWSFFLSQALFVVIPALLDSPRADSRNEPAQRFKHALRTAQAAERRLQSTP